jgi:Zn ribbon nucleic-acid-binding protein
MPAYVQHHIDDTAPLYCPGCAAMPAMRIRNVEPHWDQARIEFVYECIDCGIEVRQTLTRPLRRQHAAA